MKFNQTLTATLAAAAVTLVASGAPVFAADQNTIPKGTTATGTLLEHLDSATEHDGDHFELKLQPGWFTNKTLKGTELEGHVEGVHPAAKFHKKGAMELVFDDLKAADGTLIPVQVRLISTDAIKPQGHKLRNAAIVIGGAVVGHHLAKKYGKKHGALAGAAAATAIVLAMPGGDIDLKKGTKIQVKFEQPVNLLAQ